MEEAGYRGTPDTLYREMGHESDCKQGFIYIRQKYE